MAKTNGKGSIVQLEKDKPRGKCRKWQLRVSLGKNPRTGKYTVKTRTFKGTYTQANAALREFIDELEDNRALSRAAYTFKQYAARYVESRETDGKTAPNTVYNLKLAIKAASLHLGYADMGSITAPTLSDMFVAMRKGDTLSGKPASGTWCNKIYDVITLVFDRAVEEGLIPANPCKKAKLPNTDTEERQALAPSKAHELLSLFEPESEREIAWLLALTLGLRRGEICGLSWSDVSFELGTVRVMHNFDQYGNLRPPKTKAGRRLIPMPTVTRQALLAHKRAQRERFERLDNARTARDGRPVQSENSPVVAGYQGQRIHPNSLTRWWTEDRVEFGLDGWRLHDLRHTYLTMLALNGVHPKVMQELAGHSSAKFTMDIYTHVNLDAKRAAVAAVSNVFNKEEPLALPTPIIETAAIPLQQPQAA